MFGLLPVLAFKNNAAMNIHVPVFVLRGNILTSAIKSLEKVSIS